jgi:hypothetical protein
MGHTSRNGDTDKIDRPHLRDADFHHGSLLTGDDTNLSYTERIGQRIREKWARRRAGRTTEHPRCDLHLKTHAVSLSSSRACVISLNVSGQTRVSIPRAPPTDSVLDDTIPLEWIPLQGVPKSSGSSTVATGYHLLPGLLGNPLYIEYALGGELGDSFVDHHLQLLAATLTPSLI